jgi:hypothetical protein
MRPKFRAAALILAATMALGSTTALAANDDATTITGVNASAIFTTEGSEDQLTVTYSGDLVAGTQYLVLMVTCDNVADLTVTDGTLNGTPSYSITENSILYIDQTAADATGSITFQVYPSSVQDSIILITSTNGTVIAAIVDAKYILGDLTGDGIINVADAMVLLQYVAKVQTSLTQTQLKAAELNGVAGVDVGDAMILLQYVAKVIPSLNVNS